MAAPNSATLGLVSFTPGSAVSPSVGTAVNDVRSGFLVDHDTPGAEQLLFTVAGVIGPVFTRVGSVVDVDLGDGDLSVGNVVVSGNLTVLGTSVIVDTEVVAIEDPLIKLASNNVGDAVDVGFYGTYNDGTQRYTGLYRDATTGVYELFDTLVDEPTTTVDRLAATYALAGLSVGDFTAQTAVIGDSTGLASSADLAKLLVAGQDPTSVGVTLAGLAGADLSYNFAVGLDPEAGGLRYNSVVGALQLYIGGATRLFAAADHIRSTVDVRIDRARSLVFWDDVGFNTSIVATVPTADRTLTLPNASGTFALLEVAQSWSALQTFVGVQVNGNIGVTGTVDGRDVSVDGAKLDGIESGATGDQTGAEIVGLIDTELGSTDWRTGGGVSDHGALTGLLDDDHTQYHTDARALTWLGTRSTTDLPEGTNLYYTDARVSALVDKDFVDALNVDADTVDGLHASAFATAAQGSLADSAVQPGDNANTLGSGAAADGQVLTADGLGGVVWETPASSGTDGKTLPRLWMTV